MRFCKYCGTEISETDELCPNCGRNLKSNSTNEATQKNSTINHIETVTKSIRKHPKFLFGIVALIVCALIVLIAVNPGKCKYSGCGNKGVSGSDYCYSHKCAVESCKDSRFLYSNYCYKHYLLYDDDAQEEFGSDPVYSHELKISNVKLSSNSSYTIAEGTITNNSDQTVSFVEIKGAFKTSSGSVVDTDWTYAVGSEGLAPGESCKWRLSVSKDWSIKDCTVTVIDFDY